MRLCFVCLGNICRSPTAEGVMAALVAEAGLGDRIVVDSAGTGELAPGRAARRHGLAPRPHDAGVELTSRASTFLPGDALAYDLVLAMDRSNLADLRDRTDPALHRRLRLLREFDPALGDDDRWDGEVPDPWAGGDDGFVVGLRPSSRPPAAACSTTCGSSCSATGHHLSR